MPRLCGRNWSPAELRARVGGVEQLAGIEPVVLDDGPARGVRAALLRTGAGLEVEVLLDRGMDLGRATFRGLPLAYRAPAGPAHPAYYDAQGLNWLRTFGGGLLVTCGLQNVGSPCADEGRAYGLHGGISATPARELSFRSGWEGDDFRFQVSGRMREVTGMGLFGPNLVLARTVYGVLGRNTIRIEDTLTNEGFSDSALMLLYHINLGFPLLDEGGRLLIPTRKVTPRDAAARKGVAHWDRVEAPTPGYAEQVFFHELVTDAEGRASAGLVAPQRPGQPSLALQLDYRAAELPRFTQWKQLGAGAYVMGLEPANCSVLGRAAERQSGTLQSLKPGESRSFALELGVLSDTRAIRALEKKLAALRK